MNCKCTLNRIHRINNRIIQTLSWLVKYFFNSYFQGLSFRFPKMKMKFRFPFRCSVKEQGRAEQGIAFSHWVTVVIANDGHIWSRQDIKILLVPVPMSFHHWGWACVPDKNAWTYIMLGISLIAQFNDLEGLLWRRWFDDSVFLCTTFKFSFKAHSGQTWPATDRTITQSL